MESYRIFGWFKSEIIAGREWLESNNFERFIALSLLFIAAYVPTYFIHIYLLLFPFFSLFVCLFVFFFLSPLFIRHPLCLHTSYMFIFFFVLLFLSPLFIAAYILQTSLSSSFFLFFVSFFLPCVSAAYSLVRLVWQNTEELISRPFTSLYKIRLLLRDRMRTKNLRF